MRVCWIVFDIYGMLFDAISNIKKKNSGVKKVAKMSGGGGGSTIFFRKAILSHFISCFMLFSAIFNIKKNWKY